MGKIGTILNIHILKLNELYGRGKQENEKVAKFFYISKCFIDIFSVSVIKSR